jgi:amidase
MHYLMFNGNVIKRGCEERASKETPKVNERKRKNKKTRNQLNSMLNLKFTFRHHCVLPIILSSILLCGGCGPSNSNQDPLHSKDFAFELEGMSIEQMQQKFKSGKYTSKQVVQMYLDRIAKIDQDGPGLNAVLEINPDVLEIAETMDNERARGSIRGPLHGIPVLLKDNIDTGDKMKTTAGSMMLSERLAKSDAFIVQLLRASGAIILGTTNLTEWSNYRSSESKSGWSSRGGQTKNPYILDSTPCGSSAGSAVAVAADLCMVSVGTSTDGSIACPASMNAVVGITPTFGLISRTGIIPVSKSLDTPGTFGRTVRDATMLLDALIVEDPEDSVTLHIKRLLPKNYTAMLDAKSLRGKRIGIEQSLLGGTDLISQLLQQALDLMQKQGATIVPVSFSQLYYDINESEHIVLKYEFKDGINNYFADCECPVKSLDDIIAYNENHSDIIMPSFGQDLMLEAQKTTGLDAEEYVTAHKRLKNLAYQLQALMESNHLDVLCGVGNAASGPASVAGFPSITVPMGLVNEIPVGITFFSLPYSESKLFSLAYAYETHSNFRTSPKFLPSKSGQL